MAVEITETKYDVVPNFNGRIIKFKGTKSTQHDWIVFPYPVGLVVVNQADGTVDTVSYATCASTDDAAGALTDSATDDTFTYDDCSAASELPSTDGYIMMENEIMKYTAGGAGTTGTFTGLARGLFGTTVASHAQNTTAYILNTVLLGDTVTGLVRGIAEIIDE